MANENTLEKGKSLGKPLRLLRPSIVVLCGPAACGKSTFAQRHFRPTQIVSSDWARAQICDDERDQRFNPQAFALVHFVVEQRLTANRLCVIDSTALTPQARKDLLNLAKRYQVPSTLLILDVPLATCLERDTKRERSVGSAVIERQYRAFEEGKATFGQEGFDQVVEISDEDAGHLQIEILFRPIMRSGNRPEVGAGRRFERSAQPSKAHFNHAGNNGHPIPAAPPSAPRGAAVGPDATTGSVPAPKVAAPRPIETPSQTSGTQPSSTVHSPAPGIPPKPEPPTAPRQAPPETDTSSGS